MILAFDVSNSMRANDLKPTRMDAAKAAAHAFVEKQPSSIQIGVVAFSDGALVTQQPTTVKADVLAAIDRLTPIGRHVARPGHLHLAQRDRRQAADARPERARQRRRRQRRHRLLRLGRHRAAVRRREHVDARPARRSPSSRRSPACRSTRSASAARRAPSSRSTASASRRRSTRTTLTQIAIGHRRHVLQRPGRRRRWRRSTSSIDLRGHDRPEEDRGDGAAHAASASCSCWSAPPLSLVWFGRLV